MSSEFAGKSAFVTGGGSGIGAQTCVALATRGAVVAVVDFNLENALQTVERIEAQQGRAIAIQADVSNPGDMEAAVGKSVDAFGALHLAVNNAGIAVPFSALHEVSVETWSRNIAVNLTGVFLALKYEIPALIASGGGAVVNLSSILGGVALAGRAPYVAAKHGVVGITKAAALDYVEQGVRVNAVAPGYVDTPLLSGRGDDEKEKIAALHPMGRLARSNEIMEAILFLLSDKASFTTGQTWFVDGGYTAR
ncbi:SDR family NAD(P)-dependent oxidoreductase [Paraburkholderia unamae]|uniref:NAD(P)-dependent dehydrogenase (Short-subunit alcohol dehydrogenase family) n=1 Tax=Paraburkholderia unamae TaxID=219649 RepID=A0ABX5KUC6_9BURK|nr:SDR family NAD(P)-dependent oxidoreductase [Paraburkholderia unamae]PVX86723.1 NAD(P)-dependent dehydrogenase (short-subunit alcohol dehydrogenase family) [Paraburkholderia unamae]RAR67781.1 NAD(P)-dependent dehydrogenase (short-subunit alcohol dehydrogenase family) [Paraburkholderia unamae]CAG9274257.1 2,5-dichloro-2,5-cyclohexadiene-1,4-diol dehydrogenase [Paraburkholderia unamae]